METEKMLDELHEARCFLDTLSLRKRDALDALLTPEIKSKMLAIEAEYEPALTAQAEHIGAIEIAVEDRVAQEGCSAKGQHLHAVWMKGRVSWDSKKLDAYAVADPKLLAFRTEGSPTVAIRRIK